MPTVDPILTPLVWFICALECLVPQDEDSASGVEFRPELLRPSITEDAANTTQDSTSYTSEDISGYFWAKYRLRTTDDKTDQDAYGTILFDVGDSNKHRLTFSVLARASYDVQRKSQGRDSGQDFFSIEDSYSSQANGRLLRAYAGLHRIGHLEEIRLGRQELESIVEVPLFDGVSVRTFPSSKFNLRFNAFAGAPTHLFESSPSGDSIFGVGVECEPSSGSRASLHFAKVRDSLTLGTEQNEFFVLDLFQRVCREMSLTVRATVLESNARDFRARANYASIDNGLSASITYFTLLKTQRQRVTEFDPYFEILSEERPYHQLGVLVSKDIDESWTLAAGLTARELDKDSEEGAFNHEWRRYYLSPSLRDWPWRGTEISVTGELWEAEDQATRTAGVDVHHEFDESLTLGIGTEYALFKFNPVFREERENVRTIHARGSYAIGENTSLRLSLSLEDDSLDTYTTAELGLRWRF